MCDILVTTDHGMRIVAFRFELCYTVRYCDDEKEEYVQLVSLESPCGWKWDDAESRKFALESPEEMPDVGLR